MRRIYIQLATLLRATRNQWKLLWAQLGNKATASRPADRPIALFSRQSARGRRLCFALCRQQQSKLNGGGCAVVAVAIVMVQLCALDLSAATLADWLTGLLAGWLTGCQHCEWL